MPLSREEKQLFLSHIQAEFLFC